MGFFSDTKAAIDLANTADAINDCLRATMPYVSKYDIGQPFRGSDWSYIKACVDFVEPKVQYMQQRLQDLPSYKWMTTMVRTMDGHSTGAPGYIMAMSQMCAELKQQLSLR